MYYKNKTLVKYTWKDMERDCIWLAKDIKKKDWNLKYVYGPPRGGACPAVILSHRLGLKYLPVLDGVPHKCSEVLIVDDVSDTGVSLSKIPRIKKHHTVTLFVKPETIFMPELYRRKVAQNVWIQFPWEVGK